MILACYVLGLATRRVPPALTAVLLFLAGVALAPGALATDGTDLYSWLRVADRVAWFGGFFFVGAALAGIVERLVRVPGWAMVVPVALTGLRSAEAVDVGTYAGDHTLGNAAWSVLGVLAALWVFSRLPERGPQEWLAWVGRHSIVVFVAHYPVIRVLRHLIVPPPGLPGVAVHLAAGLGVSLTLAALYPRVRWLFEVPARRRTVDRPTDRPAVAVLA